MEELKPITCEEYVVQELLETKERLKEAEKTLLESKQIIGNMESRLMLSNAIIFKTRRILKDHLKFDEFCGTKTIDFKEPLEDEGTESDYRTFEYIVNSKELDKFLEDDLNKFMKYFDEDDEETKPVDEQKFS